MMCLQAKGDGSNLYRRPVDKRMYLVGHVVLRADECINFRKKKECIKDCVPFVYLYISNLCTFCAFV